MTIYQQELLRKLTSMGCARQNDERDGTLLAKRSEKPMYFVDDDALRELERLMRSIPNFPPRDHGVILLCRSLPDGIYSGDQNARILPAEKKKAGVDRKTGFA